jgi:hypothetical protein
MRWSLRSVLKEKVIKKGARVARRILLRSALYREMGTTLREKVPTVLEG